MDIIKLIIIIIGALLIVLIGIIIKYRFKKKCIYLENLLEIANYLKIEISFNKTNIKEIIKKIDNANLSEEIKKVLQRYNEQNIFILELLKENENKLVDSYFNSVGQSDLQTAISLTEKFIFELNILNEKYRQEYIKNGNLILKLCICLSLVFMIIFA